MKDQTKDLTYSHMFVVYFFPSRFVCLSHVLECISSGIFKELSYCRSIGVYEKQVLCTEISIIFEKTLFQRTASYIICNFIFLWDVSGPGEFNELFFWTKRYIFIDKIIGFCPSLLDVWKFFRNTWNSVAGWAYKRTVFEFWGDKTDTKSKLIDLWCDFFRTSLIMRRKYVSRQNLLGQAPMYYLWYKIN